MKKSREEATLIVERKTHRRESGSKGLSEDQYCMRQQVSD